MGIGGGFRFPDADDDVSIRAIHAALDRGINIIDTAPVYGFGHSEELIGRAIRGKRDKVILSTKCGLWWGDDEGSYRFTWDGHAVKRNLSPRTIRIEVEDSLRRLQTDHIDIYYTHNPACPPFLTPIEDTIATLLALRDEGKILAIGASNCTVDDIGHYLAADAIEIVQLKYNLLERGVEKDVLPICEANRLSLHAYSPLAAGLLTGRFAAGHTLHCDRAARGQSAVDRRRLSAGPRLRRRVEEDRAGAWQHADHRVDRLSARGFTRGERDLRHRQGVARRRRRGRR